MNEVPSEIIKLIIDCLELWPDISALACTCSRLSSIVKKLIQQQIRVFWDKNYKKDTLNLHRLCTRVISDQNETACGMVRANIGFYRGKHAWTIKGVNVTHSAAVTAGVVHSFAKKQLSDYISNRTSGEPDSAWARGRSILEGQAITIYIDMDYSEFVKVIYFFLNGKLESSKLINLNAHWKFYKIKEKSELLLYPALSMWFAGNVIDTFFHVYPPEFIIEQVQQEELKRKKT